MLVIYVETERDFMPSAEAKIARDRTFELL